jgi:hypothetical protein
MIRLKLWVTKRRKAMLIVTENSVYEVRRDGDFSVKKIGGRPGGRVQMGREMRGDSITITDVLILSSQGQPVLRTSPIDHMS